MRYVLGWMISGLLFSPLPDIKAHSPETSTKNPQTLAVVWGSVPTQGGATPRITAMDAFTDLPSSGADIVRAGKGREFVRVRIEGAPGPCDLSRGIPSDFKLVEVSGKQHKGISVEFSGLNQQLCDSFEVYFSETTEGAAFSRLLMKDAAMDLTGAPKLRHELRAAVERGYVKAVLTAKEEGTAADVTVQNPGLEPLGLFIDKRRSYLDTAERRIVLLADERQDIDVPAGGEITVSFHIRQLGRGLWTTGKLVAAPLGSK